MRRRDRETTSRTALFDLIARAKVCRMAVCDGDEPYVVPLSFGCDGTDLYFHSAREGKKIDILSRNNRVCVEFDESGEVYEEEPGLPCSSEIRYSSVICRGTASIVTDPSGKQYGLNLVIRQYRGDKIVHAFTESQLATVSVIKVHIEEITGKTSVRLG